MKKLKNNDAFSLAETLMAVLILLMVTEVVAVGIPSAANALSKIVDASNAQLLLSTTITKLRDEIATARVGSGDEISAKDGIINYVDENGISCVITSKTTGGSADSTQDAETPMIGENTDIEPTGESAGNTNTNDDGPGIYINKASTGDYLLVSKATANQNLHATCTFAYENGVVTVSNLTIYKEDRPIVSEEKVEIKVWMA